ncbi:zinc finger protein 583-like [Diorhabda sublineata]|uniref:zinc finger protein 583-like n=1 Tax=Diorhabda sublineata TaxID=1163346 RepID=UPI0024E18ECE|nr:zinc finger protein 583-like [Diorhabda sublineata]
MKMELEIITLANQMCRTCLREEADKSIFDLHKPSSTDFASILRSFIPIEINNGDGLPKHICKKCLKILLSFQKFKISTMENDLKLRKVLEEKVKKRANQQAIYTIQSMDVSIDGSKEQIVSDIIPLGQTFEVISAVVIDNTKSPPVPKESIENKNMNNDTLSTDDLTFVTDSDSSEYDNDSCKSGENMHLKVKTGWKCNICEKVLGSKGNLNQHMSIHGKNRPYSCNVCDKKFTRADHVLIHKRIHTGERPHKCLICKKTFIQYATLKAHLGTHSNEKPHMCTVCGKSFKQAASLSSHNRIHTGEVPFVCELCGKGFRTGGTLSIHMRFHLNERPYICIYCDKTFVTSSHLRVHHKSHTGEKSHICIICHKAFTRSEHLKSHLVIHSGRKPYQCIMCPRKYTQSSHLRRHVKTVHENKI